MVQCVCIQLISSHNSKTVSSITKQMLHNHTQCCLPLYIFTGLQCGLCHIHNADDMLYMLSNMPGSKLMTIF